MRALNAARVHTLAGSGWIRSPGLGDVTSPFPWGSSTRLDFSYFVFKEPPPWGTGSS